MTTSLILGGSSGIGLATARRLHVGGAVVHVAARGRERLDALALTDPGLIAHQVDALNAVAVAAVARRIGVVDQLIVTLSGSEGPGAIADLDLTVLRRAFDAKFWGHITAVQAVLPYLADDGSITLVGAVSARAGIPGTAGIAAINGAVEALIKPLAVELSPRRVNGVSPGVVDTPWWDGVPAELREGYFAQVAKSLPVRRIASADDIAEVVVLAATNLNLSGTVIEADGGARLVSVG